MLKKILVANRGEIAVRIIRECLDTSIEAVAVYSTADSESLHRMIATESVCIGGSAARDSYLNMGNIIEAAKGTGAEAIHPGFGFLSESSEFARKCREEGLIFIGPSPETIDLMGNKSAARGLMQKAGVPVVPGSDGIVENPDQAAEIAGRIGYPVLIKASAGGGGKGMRKAADESQVREGFLAASLEAENCFGDGSVYIEKLIENPRHIEIQILADSHGNVIELGDRDCSIQRRNQKLCEEAPARNIPNDMRQAMKEAARKAAKAANYVNAGTIEFIVDKENNFYFIEMNTRLQVEHPVTEMVTGVNIVREQLRVASGLPLSVSQEDVEIKGHSIECRITAEDAFNDFRPDPGKIAFLHFPAGSGIRVDSALYNGCAISPYYDSMIAKVIVKGENRNDAIRKMRRALEEMIISGVKTTLPIQHLLMYNETFIRGNYDTGFIEANLGVLLEIYKAAGEAVTSETVGEENV